MEEMARSDNTLIGQVIEVNISEISEAGHGLIHYQGFDIAVANTIKNERVLIEVTGRRKSFLVGTLKKIVLASTKRTTAPCHLFGICTGCQWQHIKYDEQLLMKQEQVRRHLSKVLTCLIRVEPTLPSPSVYGYRNHARFTVRHGMLGFVGALSHRFVPVSQCMLMNEGINYWLTKLQGNCSQTSQVAIRSGQNTSDYLIQPTMESPPLGMPTGQSTFREALGDDSFQIGSPSFFQVNSAQTVNLAAEIISAFDNCRGGIIVDAYAGVGTLAVLAAPHAGKILAIEESFSAIEDARINIENHPNIEIMQGKTEVILKDLKMNVDALILDPPRSGCHPDAIASVRELAPNKVVYVSCDPESLSRDLGQLVPDLYDIERIQPVDMFPNTHHVECVVSLKLK
jgi:23S rRNA (uracil1939-C5)-methyltransferase